MHFFLSVFFIATAISTAIPTYSDDTVRTTRYKDELKHYIENPKQKELFARDPDIATDLVYIQRDVHNYQHSTFLQRLINGEIFACDVIIVTPETLPQLYGYIESICTTHGITMPMVCISRGEGIMNAFATEFLSRFGCTVLCQKIILETSDQALEAVVAHELGHIKYGHTTKILLIDTAVTIALGIGYCSSLEKRPNIESLVALYTLGKSNIAKYLYIPMISYLYMITRGIIINKRFEKIADEFAYKDCGQGDGLIQFLEQMDAIEKIYEEGFGTTYELVKARKENLGSFNYLYLMCRYYTVRSCDYLRLGYNWLSENTFLGLHPSNAARIQAIREYQETQEVIAQQ